MANRYLYELGVLQRGWDEVMGEIYAYFEEVSLVCCLFRGWCLVVFLFFISYLLFYRFFRFF